MYLFVLLSLLLLKYQILRPTLPKVFIPILLREMISWDNFKLEEDTMISTITEKPSLRDGLEYLSLQFLKRK